MYSKEVKAWLREKAIEELGKTINELNEIKELHKEYKKRNSGVDGWEPGIWYQEGELAEEIPILTKRVKFLKKVVSDLR